MVPVLSKIVNELNNEQNFRVRIKAVSKLSSMTGDESLDLLLFALRDPYFRVRVEAAQALTHVQDPRVIEPLVAAVTDIPSVRDAALEALQARPLPEEIQSRISDYQDTYLFYKRRKELREDIPLNKDSEASLFEAARSPDFLIREAAVQAAGSIHNEYAFSLLLQASDDLYPSVREAAIRAIGKYEGALSIRVLTEAMNTSNWVLFDALVDLMFDRTYQHTKEVLIDLLQSKDFIIRRRARVGLSRMPDSPELTQLVGSLSIWDSPEMHIPAYTITQFYKENLWDHVTFFSRAMFGLMGSIVERDWPAGIEALRSLSELKEWRHLAFFSTADLDRRNQFDVTSALDHTFTTQKKYANEYLCMRHLARFSGHIHEGNRFLGCRICTQTHLSTRAPTLVLVIDSTMTTSIQVDEHSCRVNWLKERPKMDFDTVEIGTCAEDAIVEFCIDIGNDTDPFRIHKYKTADCQVKPGIALSVETMNLLRNQFKKVVSL